MSIKNDWVVVNSSNEEKESKMKVLVTGASGLLGRQIMSTLRAAAVPCLGLSYSRPSDNLTRLDLRDLEATRDFILNQAEWGTTLISPDPLRYCALSGYDHDVADALKTQLS